MHRNFPVDSFTPSMYLKALKRSFLIVLLSTFFVLPSSAQQGTFAVDDWAINPDISISVYVSTNDANPFGLLAFPTQPSHGNITACNTGGLGCEPWNVHYNKLNATGIGVDFFQYKYVVCCGNPPAPDSNIATVIILNIPDDDATNAGYSCPIKGDPVNVTNGNMWISHHDYSLPGLGDPIEINRFYNSIIQTTGLFGLGWSTKYDESIVVYDPNMIRLNRPDGKAIYFGRKAATDPYLFSFSKDVTGKIVPNVDGTYTLTYLDGSVRNFSSS